MFRTNFLYPTASRSFPQVSHNIPRVPPPPQLWLVMQNLAKNQLSKVCEGSRRFMGSSGKICLQPIHTEVTTGVHGPEWPMVLDLRWNSSSALETPRAGPSTRMDFTSNKQRWRGELRVLHDQNTSNQLLGFCPTFFVCTQEIRKGTQKWVWHVFEHEIRHWNVSKSGLHRQE